MNTSPTLTAGQWFTCLLDHLPNAYVHAHASDLAELRADGCTPGEAAAYARAYMHAPRIYDERTDGPHGLPLTGAAPVGENTHESAGPGASSRPNAQGWRRLLDDLSASDSDD